MSNLFSVNWWISMLVSTFMTMFFMWLIKKAAAKANIPVVSSMIEEV